MHNKNPKKTKPDTRDAAGAPARIHPFVRFLLYCFVLSTVLLLGGVFYAASYLSKIEPDTPDAEDMLEARAAQPSVLLSAGGTLLATFARGQQEQVTLDRISPHVIRALIATEDHRFYDHRGIDLTRTASAIYRTLRGDAQGGSTITQQLVRNMFPEEIGRARTVDRKLREIITALKIEKAYTKDQILETYLNSVPFLYNVIGIEMAARTYYDKSAADLDLLESATLVGMLKGTSYYNPVQNPDRARKRRNVVLGQMVKYGMLNDEVFRALREQPLQVTLTRQPDPLGHIAPHFAAYVRRQLVEWADANDYNLYTDGLVVHSTLDDRLQEAAAAAVERQSEVLQTIADVEWGRSTEKVASHTPSAYAALRKKVEPFRYFWSARADLLDAFVRETPEYRRAIAAGRSDKATLAKLKADDAFMQRLRDSKTRLEAGFVAMDPTTGEVKAWVGSRNFERDQFDHVGQAERQPGSTFKPIVYGAALEQGLGPDRTYPDGQVEIRAADGSVWRPTDMSGFSGRMMTMREGLIFSKNTITAQVMQDVGLPQVIDLARAVGVKQSRLDPVPSLSLGTSPVTLLEMVSAYSTIAKVGEYRKPVFITKITDREGNVLAEFDAAPQRVMSEETAVELIDMMRGVVRRGTGTEVRNRFNIAADIAGKTGTTQNNTDGWFILMHPRLVAGAWVGFNDSRVTMRSDHWGQGGHNAILLVGDFFRGTLKSKLIDVKAKFPQPKRPPPLIVKTPEDAATTVPSGYGVITRDDSEVLIGPDGTRTVERGRHARGSEDAVSTMPGDELGRFLSGLGRDPATGARPDNSSGASEGRGNGGAGAGDLLFPEVGQ
ncbi:MAG TPA: PBP1A family penicillin-binding protein [Noviherbaspirillum sp.]|uniref:penicillin-binding protein 1A n=1 Tax=Noviherbaspirillum sp. TaxID=1926288 RepID=UPI002D529A27|nr:PBP1A family penicillin-binding protein [Noviherbaspirillum sp.]HYD96976.1 PBP1A family penicillin-binding protein [Noviherbaspirillum sp.]